jgi:hypothetical protein
MQRKQKVGECWVCVIFFSSVWGDVLEFTIPPPVAHWVHMHRVVFYGDDHMGGYDSPTPLLR